MVSQTQIAEYEQNIERIKESIKKTEEQPKSPERDRLLQRQQRILYNYRRRLQDLQEVQNRQASGESGGGKPAPHVIASLPPTVQKKFGVTPTAKKTVAQQQPPAEAAKAQQEPGTFLASQAFIDLYKLREPEIREILTREAQEKAERKAKSEFQLETAGMTGFLLKQKLTEKAEKAKMTGEPVNIYGSYYTIQEPSKYAERYGGQLPIMHIAGEDVAGKELSISEKVGVKIEQAKRKGYLDVPYVTAKPEAFGYYPEKAPEGGLRKEIYGGITKVEAGAEKLKLASVTIPTRFGFSVISGAAKEAKEFVAEPLYKTGEYAFFGAATYLGGAAIGKVATKVKYLKPVAKYAKTGFYGAVVTTAVAVPTITKVAAGEPAVEAAGESVGRLAVPVLGVYGLVKGARLTKAGVEFARGQKYTPKYLKGVAYTEFVEGGKVVKRPQMIVEAGAERRAKPFTRLPQPDQKIPVVLSGKSYGEVSPMIHTTQEVAGYGLLMRTKQGTKLVTELATETPKAIVTYPTSLVVPKQYKFSVFLKSRGKVRGYERVILQPAELLMREDIGFTESGKMIEGLKGEPKITSYPYIKEKRIKVAPYMKTRKRLFTFEPIEEMMPKGQPTKVIELIGRPTKIKNLPAGLREKWYPRKVKQPSAFEQMFKQKKAELDLKAVDRLKKKEMPDLGRYERVTDVGREVGREPLRGRKGRLNFLVGVSSTDTETEADVRTAFVSEGREQLRPPKPIAMIETKPVSKPSDIVKSFPIPKQIPDITPEQELIITPESKLIPEPRMPYPTGIPEIPFNPPVPILSPFSLPETPLFRQKGRPFSRKYAYAPDLQSLARFITKKGKPKKKKKYSPIEPRPIYL